MTKEHEFKLRFAAVLQDLQENGAKDQDAMLLLGSLASDLADNLKRPTWSAAKAAMSPKAYDMLLQTFEQQGNEHHQAGRDKQAYVIQILAVSHVARTQRADPQLQAGEALLDQFIDHAVAVYRKVRKTTVN